MPADNQKTQQYLNALEDTDQTMVIAPPQKKKKNEGEVQDYCDKMLKDMSHLDKQLEQRQLEASKKL